MYKTEGIGYVGVFVLEGGQNPLGMLPLLMTKRSLLILCFYFLPKINIVHWIIFPSRCWNIVFDFCLVLLFDKQYFMMAKKYGFQY